MDARNVQTVEVMPDIQSAPVERVRMVVEMTREAAETLAAARIARGGSDLLAADCKPIAHAAADALVAAGLGRG